MTQIRAFSKRLRIPIRDVVISTKLHWEGEQIGREPYVGQPIAFHLDIDIDTDVSAEDVHRLFEAGRKGCFLEATLERSNTITHRLKVDGEWVDV